MQKQETHKVEFATHRYSDVEVIMLHSATGTLFLSAMMQILLLFLCLTGHVFAKKPPDVDCIVMHLKYVHCSWNKQGTPEVNYTFYGRFHNDEGDGKCVTYLVENGTAIGCNVPYTKSDKRFESFYSKLIHGNNSQANEHFLKNKVKLNPPANITVQNGSDFNLWFYWNQTSQTCVESEVRFRTNNNKWEEESMSTGRQSFCINLPSSRSRYELQVRSRIAKICAESLYWSDWSEPAVWGSHNNSVPNQRIPMSVWTPLLYVLAPSTLIILVMMLIYHERLRIIFIPVFPKPDKSLNDIEAWLQKSKGFKEGFQANYNERPCNVREYCHVSQSDNDSSDSSTLSVTTDQTDCSVSIPANESEESTPCSSSPSTALVSSEEQQVSV